ncbi:UNKNOWN [Stylonychia lemnae]|uniref:Uncharacterized protein n=1 Tax=Stylonychia lemnae TaxID=5949 RepID=A0A078BB76_STYLE|nr:UNKNOWN [Stylonychia lemnae]|eukprot:CDW91644.1 UNKNOWN [Stylonychia lemnae]
MKAESIMIPKKQLAEKFRQPLNTSRQTSNYLSDKHKIQSQIQATEKNFSNILVRDRMLQINQHNLKKKQPDIIIELEETQNKLPSKFLKNASFGVKNISFTENHSFDLKSSVSQDSSSGQFEINPLQSASNHGSGNFLKQPINKNELLQYTPQPERCNNNDLFDKNGFFKFNFQQQITENFNEKQNDDYEVYSIKSLSNNNLNNIYHNESSRSIIPYCASNQPTSNQKKIGSERMSIIMQEIEMQGLNLIKEDQLEYIPTYRQTSTFKREETEEMADQDIDEDVQKNQVSQPYMNQFNMISLLKVVHRNSDFNVSRQQTSETTYTKDKLYSNGVRSGAYTLKGQYDTDSTDIQTPLYSQVNQHYFQSIYQQKFRAINSDEKSQRQINRRNYAQSSKNVLWSVMPRTLSPEPLLFRKNFSNHEQYTSEQKNVASNQKCQDERYQTTKIEYKGRLEQLSEIQTQNMKLSHLLKILNQKKSQLRFKYELISRKNTELKTQINFLNNVKVNE